MAAEIAPYQEVEADGRALAGRFRLALSGGKVQFGSHGLGLIRRVDIAQLSRAGRLQQLDIGVNQGLAGAGVAQAQKPQQRAVATRLPDGGERFGKLVFGALKSSGGAAGLPVPHQKV